MSPEQGGEKKRGKEVPKDILKKVFVSAMPFLRYELGVRSNEFGVLRR
jgi:hypothetical protein